MVFTLWAVGYAAYSEITEKNNWLPFYLIIFFLAFIPFANKYQKNFQGEIFACLLFAAGSLVLGFIFDNKDIAGIGFGAVLVCFTILEIPHLTNKLKAGMMGVVSAIALWGYMETEYLNYASLTAMAALCALASLFRDSLTKKYFWIIEEKKKSICLVVALIFSMAAVKFFHPIP